MSWFREWLRGPEAPERPEPVRTSSSPTRETTTPSSPTRAREPGDQDPPSYPGERFGLPEHGPDSVATLGVRGGQFVLDLVIAGLVTVAIDFPPPQWLSTAVWLVLTLPTVALLGQTPAMMLLGLRVARIDGVRLIGLWALARSFSLLFVLPALFLDRDARGLQDRVSRTIVLRTR